MAEEEMDMAAAMDADGGEDIANVLSDDSEGNLTFDAVSDISVNISVVLGKTNMPVSQVLKLGRGAVVELDRKVGEPIDIYVNNRLIARGEVVVVEDRIGVTMTEIIKPEQQVKK